MRIVATHALHAVVLELTPEEAMHLFRLLRRSEAGAKLREEGVDANTVDAMEVFAQDLLDDLRMILWNPHISPVEG